MTRDEVAEAAGKWVSSRLKWDDHEVTGVEIHNGGSATVEIEVAPEEIDVGALEDEPGSKTVEL